MSLINPLQVAALVEMAKTTPAGGWAEVGVYQGGSASALMRAALEQGRRLWLFDTFTGIPCRTVGLDAHQIGDFSDCSLSAVRELIPEAEIVVGDCRTTLAETLTGPLAFVHVDCDQYESVRACIADLGSRMVPGGVMWFDDYGCLEGANEACRELLPGRMIDHDCGKSFARF